jgi:hypothetical protein
MNQEQARIRAEQIVTETAKAAAPDIQGTIDAGKANQVGYCLPPVADRVAVTVIDYLPVLTADHNQQIAGSTRRYWEKLGYRILAADSPGGTPCVIARTSDGFDLSFVVSTDRSSSFEANSPCVTPTAPSP